ncbi:unnamed protein product [Lymnaea stagnalis]|uniref:RRM domain-containing protein n=1 Tax=Lymnaea stagnalis TaxID=6523 RepID=A0AAV2I1U7_LYMST
MSEDNRTLWVGGLDDGVTEELLYELFLQTGPIERLILLPAEEGEEKKHAYVVFQHGESVQYASQVLEGSSLFSSPLVLKARSLPQAYKKPAFPNGQGGRGRFDSSSLRGGMNKSSTWHGGNDFAPRGRGNFRNRGGVSNYPQNTGYNTGYSNYPTSGNQMANSAYWMTGQQGTSADATQVTAYSTSGTSLDDKKTRLMQQQNMTLDAHRHIQQGVMNMATQMYGMAQPGQTGMWNSNGYSGSSGSWNMGGAGDSYQGYTTDQYGNWYQQ